MLVTVGDEGFADDSTLLFAVLAYRCVGIVNMDGYSVLCETRFNVFC